MCDSSMPDERSVAALSSLPETPLYTVVMAVLLLGTAVALSLRANWIGLVGLLVLSVMSLFYGAVVTADDIP